MNGQADAKRRTSRRDADSATGASSGLAETFVARATWATEVVDSSAGHDCERQSTGVGWISNDKPATACNESCASTNTDRKHLQSATLEQRPEGARGACPLRTLSATAQCAGSHFLNALDQRGTQPSLGGGVLIMKSDPTFVRRSPPPTAIVRAALATPRPKLCAAVLPMAQANAAAAALGACIGCLKGDKLAIGLVDDVNGHVVGLAVCSSPVDADVADPHTLEVRCLLLDPARDVTAEALWNSLERIAGERGYRRLVVRGPRDRPPALPGSGWCCVRAAGVGRFGGSFVPGAIWSRVLRGEMH